MIGFEEYRWILFREKSVGERFQDEVLKVAKLISHVDYDIIFESPATGIKVVPRPSSL